MSWLNQRYLDLMCKLKPHGKTCEAHIRAQHPECFQTYSRIGFILEIPQKIYRLFVGNKCGDMQPVYGSDCCSLLLQEHESSIIGPIWKCLLLLGILIGILYARLKFSAQRPASLQ